MPVLRAGRINYVLVSARHSRVYGSLTSEIGLQ